MKSLLLIALALCLQCLNAANYRVLVGWEDGLDQFLLPTTYSLWFYPTDLTIAYGDSVTWEFPTKELHNIVFTNGVRRSETQPNGVNFTDIAGIVGNTTHFTDYALDYSSGIRGGNAPTYTLTFIPTAGSGTFQYYCSIHTGMDGTITVLPSGQTAPQTPLQVNTSVDSQIADLQAAASLEVAAVINARPTTGPQVTHTVMQDGSINWQVVAGQMLHGDGMQMYARFEPTYLEIQQGDTVTWVIGGEDPHWVFWNAQQTFPPIFANYQEGEILNASISYASPPYVLGITWFDGPAPSPVIPPQTWPNQIGYINSGLMFGPMGPPVFPKSISVRFTTTGTIDYSCPIHLDLGMRAQIVVKQRGSPLCTDFTQERTCVRVPGGVRGDPSFTGLRGQSYQVHGIDGGIYNLVSSQTTQVNSRFVFLDHGKCPIFDGIPASNCWAHPGSYLGEIGVQQVVNGVTHKLVIVAGASDAGFAKIEVNGEEMSVGEAFEASELFSVKYESSHSVTIQTEEFTFTFENSDMFINQLVSANKPLQKLTAHGLFGQTHKQAVYPTSLRYIVGAVDDYLIAENELFGKEFVYNKFGTSQ